MYERAAFGTWLHERRRELDLTQEELASLVGCSRDLIKKIELSQRRPSKQIAELVAVALGIALEERAHFIYWARVEQRTAHSLDTLAVNIAEPTEPAKVEVSSGPHNPYKGLLAFGEADADNFFGRESHIARLLERMEEHTENTHFIALVGPSGSGKSSIVRAGLIPALRKRGLPGGLRPIVVDMIPGTHPFGELKAAISRMASGRSLELLHSLSLDNEDLQQLVELILQDEPEAGVLLFIDQFEEIFTLVSDEATRTSWLKALFAVMNDRHSHLWVVAALRADFYDRPLQYRISSKLFQQRVEILGPMEQDELHRAIIAPSERVGIRLEPGLVAIIEQDVGRQPGSLPLMQYALTELFEQREGEWLTVSAYQSSGGLVGALSRRAEAIYTEMNKGEQEEARQLFLRLVTPGEGVEYTCRRVRRAELASAAVDEDALDEVLEQFGSHRLLTFDRDPVSGGPTVEVAHEALLRVWDRLQEWLEASRSDLRLHRQLLASATEWANANQESSFLATGARLAHFDALASEGVIALTKAETRYLQASLTQRDQQAIAERKRGEREIALQKRSAGRLRAFVVALGVFLVLASCLAVLAFNRSQAAQASADEAHANLSLAESQRLAAEANRILQINESTELATLLSVSALKIAYSPQADAALAQAAGADHGRRILTSQTGGGASVAFSPDGKYALATVDNIARLWDVQTGKEVQRFSGHTSWLMSAVFSPDGKHVLTGSNDHTARLWDVQTGKEVQQFLGHSGRVWGVAFSPDGKYVLTGSYDKTARLWDIETGKELRIFTHPSLVAHVAFSPDGKYVLTGSIDNIARLWDVQTGKELRQYAGHTASVVSVTFSPDGKYVLTGSSDHTARLWDTQTGEELRQFVGHTAGLVDVAFSPDGKYVLTGASDKTARLWDAQTGIELRVLGERSEVFGVAFSPDGTYVLTGASDGTVRLWDTQPVQPRIFMGHTDGVTAVKFSPDGKYVLTGSADNSARLWDAQTGQELREFLGHTSFITIRAIDFSPDGKYVLTGSADNSARLWDAQTGQELREFLGHSDRVTGASFSPDGKQIVTSSFDKTARIWDVETGMELRALIHPDVVTGAVFSPDSKYVLTGGDDNLARLWDAQTGQELRKYSGHTDVVTGEAFSPDGKYILTGSLDRTVRLWDTATGGEVRRFVGHTNEVGSVAFSPDGKEILTSSLDNTARLWDVATGRQMRIFAHTAAVSQAVFSPDGKYVLTGSDDMTAKVWDTDYHDLIKWACSSVLQDLTEDERVAFNVPGSGPICTLP